MFDFELVLTFSQGYIKLKGILSGTRSYGSETLITAQMHDQLTGSNTEETITYLDDDSWALEVEEFANAIQGKPYSGKVDEALKTMELVFRIYGDDDDEELLSEVP